MECVFSCESSGRAWHRRGAARGADPPVQSAAQAEALDQRAVALDVGVAQVVQQATTLADEQQQAATAVVVVLVLS